MSDADGELSLHAAGPFSHLTTDGGVPVRAVTADTIAAETGVWPRVMKLDVEGHELACLRSLERAARSAGRAMPDLVVESNGHCQWRLGSSSSELIDTLRSSYRHLYVVGQRTLRPLRVDGVVRQSVTGMDVLATDRDELPWAIDVAPDEAMLVAELLEEMEHPNQWQRRWAAWAASELPAPWDSDERVLVALDRLCDDPITEVRDAASWHRERSAM